MYKLLTNKGSIMKNHQGYTVRSCQEENYVIYRTDSDEHLISIGEMPDPVAEQVVLSPEEIQEDLDAMNDFLDEFLDVID